MLSLKKGFAQLSAHPSPYLRAQVIIKLQWLEQVADCSKVAEDVARLIYLYLNKHELSRHPPALFRKKGYPCLLRGSPPYIFIGWLI